MKVLVSLSGGLDSAVTLALAVSQNHTVESYGFDYGSKHNPLEIQAAIDLATHYNVAHHILNLKHIGANLKSCLLTSGKSVPEGHYEEESMRQTVVPGRNLIFISVLAAIAESREFDEVWLGVHRGDHFIYPDCRPEFLHHARTAVEQSSDGKVSLYFPFVNADKAEIVGRGHRLRVPFELCRTCYTEDLVACGKCGSCQERLEAFAKYGTQDPIPYQTRELLPKTK